MSVSMSTGGIVGLEQGQWLHFLQWKPNSLATEDPFERLSIGRLIIDNEYLNGHVLWSFL